MIPHNKCCIFQHANQARCCAERTYTGKKQCLAEQSYQRLKRYEQTRLSPEEVEVLARRIQDAQN